MAITAVNRLLAETLDRDVEDYTREREEVYQVLSDSASDTLADAEAAFLALYPVGSVHPEETNCLLGKYRVSRWPSDGAGENAEPDVFKVEATFRKRTGNLQDEEDDEIPPWLRPPVRTGTTVMREHAAVRGYWPLLPVAAVDGVTVPTPLKRLDGFAGAGTAIDSVRADSSDFLPEDYNFLGYVNETTYGVVQADYSEVYDNGGNPVPVVPSGDIPYAPVVNTAGFAPDPPLTYQVPHKQIVFTYNVQFYDEYAWSLIKGTINAKALGPYPAGSVMLSGLSDQEVYEGEWHFFRLTVTFDYNPQPGGWLAVFINAGFIEKCLNPTHDPDSPEYDGGVPFEERGPYYIYRRIETSEPWPLDANGRKIGDPNQTSPFDTSAVLYQSRRFYRYFDHNRLGFRFN